MDYTKFNINAKTAATSYDVGLRAFMIQVYNYMMAALALTGTVAWFAGSSEAYWQFMAANQLLFWVIAFAPLAIVIFMGVRINHLSTPQAQALFWVYSGLMGLSLASIFAVYTGASVARAFFITSAVFGSMSIYGYTTKRDLSSLGFFLIAGVWGLLLASIVNIFLQSSGLQFAVSLISVVIFTGLVAYDTQKLRQVYYSVGAGGAMLGKAAVFGALNLYIDFINIMVALLRLVGDRR